MRDKALYHLERYLKYAFADHKIPDDIWVQFTIPVKMNKHTLSVGNATAVPMRNPWNPDGTQ